MKEPDPQYEKKILLDVVAQMRDPAMTLRKQVFIKRVILGTGYLGLITVFFFALHGITHPFTSALLAAAAGCAIGFGSFLEFSQNQWPITRKHIDMDSVQHRLDELDR
jgi:hypothetical protein